MKACTVFSLPLYSLTLNPGFLASSEVFYSLNYTGGRGMEKKRLVYRDLAIKK